MKLTSHRRRRPKRRVVQIRSHRLLAPVIAGWLVPMLAWTAGSVPIHAQALPANPPTAGLIPPPPASSAPATGSAAQLPHRAQVLYANGQLEVRAQNSSLNQILRTISQQTGLQITGGVQEQRVFGDYGPASISNVLSTLLDGAGANVMILAGDAHHPPQLILTPDNGGPELPSPTSSAYAMYDESKDSESPVPPPAKPGSGSPATANSLGGGIAKPPVPSFLSRAMPTAGPGATPKSASATPLKNAPALASKSQPQPATTAGAGAAPTRVLTPEMVEQELLQMQQARAAQQKAKLKELDTKVRQEQSQAAKAAATSKTPTVPPSQPLGSASPQP